MQKTDSKADKIIKRSTYWATGAGVLPIPVGDLIAVAAVQLDMLKQLSNHYGKDYSEIRGKAFIAALNGSILARVGASMFKTLPVIGPLVGGVSMGVLSGASTYALGHVFTYYMNEYGTIENIDMEEAKEKYKEAFEEGTSVANATDAEGGEEEGDVYEQLEKLGELYKKKVITKKEFDEKKKKLLGEI